MDDLLSKYVAAELMQGDLRRWGSKLEGIVCVSGPEVLNGCIGTMGGVWRQWTLCRQLDSFRSFGRSAQSSVMSSSTAIDGLLSEQGL